MNSHFEDLDIVYILAFDSSNFRNGSFSTFQFFSINPASHSFKLTESVENPQIFTILSFLNRNGVENLKKFDKTGIFFGFVFKKQLIPTHAHFSSQPVVEDARQTYM